MYSENKCLDDRVANLFEIPRVDPMIDATRYFSRVEQLSRWRHSFHKFSGVRLLEILTIQTRQERHKHRDILKQMYLLRARQFSDRRQWDVKVIEEQETDRFDDLEPIYVTVLTQGRLLASLRLLPTCGPHMLADVFPEVMGDAPVIRCPYVWESSRFCVDTEIARSFSHDGIHMATRRVLLGLFQTAHTMGLTHVISVFDLHVERILRRVGCQFSPVGPVVTYDRQLRTRAALFDVNTDVLAILAASPRAASPRRMTNSLNRFKGVQPNDSYPESVGTGRLR